MSPPVTDRLKRLQRLRQLGVKRGTAHIPMPPPKPRPTDPPLNVEPVPLHFLNYEDDLQHPVSIEAVIPGQVIENEHGRYFSFEARYPLAGSYGQQPLARLLETPLALIATITGDDNWHERRWSDVLFIDLETTGLEIAAGTVAFLIGVGFLDGDDFVVRQVFMRDFDEEMALLHDLQSLCGRFQAVASFNGKTFDLPLLENRFVIARLFTDLFDGPHLDLLHPSRRLWRRRLENCKLATLEAEILGVKRSQADIPGYFIPSLYRKYLVDRDARTMAGIFYHNELDIVSMASLAAMVGQHFAALDQPEPIHPVDLLSLGLWQQHLGDEAAAEVTLTQVLRQPLTDDLHALAQTELASLFKRQSRLAEAEPLWQELVLGPQPLPALEELAKYYEWQRKDFDSALSCIDYALKILSEQVAAWSVKEAQATWERRRSRVQRKAGKTAHSA